MACLLVGFDSAWTRANSGAIVGALVDDAGIVRELGLPSLVRYSEAADVVGVWQAMHAPSSTLVLVDQPTIVENDAGQRPVEGIVCSVVSRLRGGMQPANKGRADVFGDDAPVWEFLSRFGGPADPFGAATATRVLETYPVLAIISLGWTLPDSQRPAGRLPKYNPERRKTFLMADWVHVCRAVAVRLLGEGMTELAAWIETVAHNSKPTKSDQDRVDACICLIAALHVARGRDALFVGNCATGYIVVPDSAGLRDQLEARCRDLAHVPSEWLRVFRLDDLAAGRTDGSVPV
jgi:predicted RNase H-like nuclease